VPRLLKFSKIIGTIAAIGIAGVFVGWWNTRVPAAKVTSTVVQLSQVSGDLLPAPSPSRTDNVGAASIEIASAAPAALAEDRAWLTNWEEKIEEVLNTPSSNSEKSAQLLAMFPRLPEEGQTEVAGTLSTLLPDAEYSELGLYLTNGTIAEPVRQVLVSELLGRPDTIRLPWLLEVARTEKGEGALDAKNMLQVLLDQDNGKDWGLWQAAVEQHLQAKTE
jgi:hypothetical protein